MLSFVAICPHPPIIIPGIGKPEDLKSVKNTIRAMEKLSEKISEKNIDTVVIISPHGVIYPDRINIAYGGEFCGDFSSFGAPDVKFDFLSDNELAKEIIEESENNGIKTNQYTENNVLDHGVLVPMYYLSQNLSENVKIVPINYSMLPKYSHFSFGEIVHNVINGSKFNSKNIALIASGDLSHRLFNSAPVEQAEARKEFYKKIVNDLKDKKTLDILEYDDDWIETAGECGYRSILILLGALSKTNYKSEILSYEGPFGVGYLVANFEILN